MESWLLIGVSTLLAAVVVYLWQRRASQHLEREKASLEGTLAAVRAEGERMRSDLNDKLLSAQRKADEAAEEIRRLESTAKVAQVALDAERARIAGMTQHYEALLAQMKHEFKSLSEDVLKEKREQFEREGVASVSKLTDSLKQEVETFRTRVDEINKSDIERTTALKKDIEALVSKTQIISDEANNLARAIRSDAQVTGQWGEMQLLRVLELGGLTRTIDYDYQETFTSPGADHADVRTDVLVKMPEDRWLVIDAKTTMAAYVDYVGEGGERNAEALSRIVTSLVEHVKEMKTAGYHKKLEATTGKHILNTMLMYIPFEEVYLTAMKCEVEGAGGKIPLREWAWQNDVVFVNASGLIPLVKMLAELWAKNRTEKKVIQIKAAAEALIDKFKLFLEGSGGKKDGFLAIGTGLTLAVTAYNESVKRLSSGRGSVMKKLTELKDMGISSVDKLPAPEQLESRQVSM